MRRSWPFANRPRDVQLTIDAGFQLRTASIVAKYAQRSRRKGRSRRARSRHRRAARERKLSLAATTPADGTDPGPKRCWTARATDSIPLGRRSSWSQRRPRFASATSSATTTFICSRLPDGRVGAKIPGWGRPIRDDVLESHPHGSINLHDGLVRSCNAYFAQLAVKLGPEPLLAAAAELGIPLTQARDVRARVDATLPQIGYGQGDVVATPLRMARVAAAVASAVHATCAGKSARPAKRGRQLDAASQRLPTPFSEAGIGASARPLHA